MKAARLFFTLVELLVVVAIMAVLMALLLPALGKAKGVAMSSACANNLKQLGIGTTMYSNDYDGYFPAETRYGWVWYIPLQGRDIYSLGDIVSEVYVPHAGYNSKSGAYFCPSHPVPASACGWTLYASNQSLVSNRLTTLRRGMALYADSLNASGGAESSTYAARWGGGWNSAYPVHGRRQNVVFTDLHTQSVDTSARLKVLNFGGGQDCGELQAAWYYPLE